MIRILTLKDDYRIIYLLFWKHEINILLLLLFLFIFLKWAKNIYISSDFLVVKLLMIIWFYEIANIS